MDTKSQELLSHRAAQQHLTDVKAHIRGLQERVDLSTRELENSVLSCSGVIPHSSSLSSSRSSSPLNMLSSGISFEDVGAVEIEEVARLEKKLVHQEKVEAAAVKKIQSLEEEISKLKVRFDQNVKDEDETELEKLKEKVFKLENDYDEERKLNVKLDTELMTLRGYNVEDLQVSLYIMQRQFAIFI